MNYYKAMRKPNHLVASVELELRPKLYSMASTIGGVSIPQHPLPCTVHNCAQQYRQNEAVS